MNEKLQSVLNKILQLTEQNSEFGVELRRKLGITSSVKATSYPSDFDKRVEHIEKYLGLDYYVDGQPSLIDYSFVKETEIRAQLISDNREMMRHRYGTRFHIINFDEYCRYAHLQVEMLLNYYYDRVDNTLDEIKKHIVKYNSTAEIANEKSLGAISYNSKLWAFCAEHNVGYSVRTIFDYIREVRNRSSHRSPEAEQITISDAQKRLKTMSLPIHKEDGYVQSYKLKESSTEYNIFNNMVKKADWYKEYLLLVWLHNQKFTEINEAIKEICNKVQNAISE